MRAPLSHTHSAPAPSRAKAAATRKTSSASDLAGYISDMSAELARLAGEAEMPMLCYFLNLARVEADFHAKGVPVPRDKI